MRSESQGLVFGIIFLFCTDARELEEKNFDTTGGNFAKARVSATGSLESGNIWSNTSTAGVQDYEGNPILMPSELGEWLLGDPTLLQLGDELHLWGNEVFHGILHFSAKLTDVTNFTKVETSVRLPGANRAYAHFDAARNTVILFYEQYYPPLFRSSKIQWVESKVDGTWKWSAPTVALEPTLEWEMIGTKRVGNPFVFFNSQVSKWWMYYSASSVHLDDADIDEPLHLGLAQADDLRGKWTRVTATPLVIVGGFQNATVLGIGSLKLVKGLNGDGTPRVALCNRVTRHDVTNVTGSTISSLKSVNGGLSWQVETAALITPTPAADPRTWKESYVYGFDTFVSPLDSNWTLVFYNARNGWRHATEAIGVSRVRPQSILRR